MLMDARRRKSQSGFVMIVALVALVIMALAGVGLMRTVSTSVSLAGNLAFEQAAATSADQAVEAAVAWLETNTGQATSASAAVCATGSTVLACSQKTYGYAAIRTDPTSTQTWPQVWASSVASGFTAVSKGTDSAGNTAAYLIQRMCSLEGDPTGSNACSASPINPDGASSKKAGSTLNANSSQIYYRITVKVTGPRDTVSFTQAMVAL